MSDRESGERLDPKESREGRISAKTLIVLIALAFFLFNVILVAIWAFVLFGR